jgi:ribosomal protein S18 acetylase RimI-like enzyme
VSEHSSLRTRLVGSPERTSRLRIAQLELLDTKCFPDDEPFGGYGDAWWWLTVHDSGQLVGFAGLQNLGRGTGFLCRAGVLPAWRGQGVQRELIRRRVAQARRLGLSELVTYTAPENYASLNNLIACGFRFTSQPAPVDVPLSFPSLRRRL